MKSHLKLIEVPAPELQATLLEKPPFPDCILHGCDDIAIVFYSLLVILYFEL